MGFIDTHAHLDDQTFDEDRDEVLQRTRCLGVEHVINIGYKPISWERSIQIAMQRANVSLTLGLHPHHADEWSQDVAGKLQSLVLKHRPVAIGETGLDFYRNMSDRGSQTAAFQDQLHLARSVGLPVIIHMRGDVESEVIEILSRFPGLQIVFHSFEGSAQLRNWAIEHGAYVGYGGLATRPSSAALRSLLQTVPIDRFVLETDSPYLSPAGWPHRRNTPESIPVIAKDLATLLAVDIDEVAEMTTSTARGLFALARVTELQSTAGLAV
jgi:TatD DNase family protein